MANSYLLKTEASAYSFEDLQRDGTTVWDGVSNPVALRNMREMQPGAKLIIYETGDRKSAVGTATVVAVDASNPKNPEVKIKAGKPLPKPDHPRRNQSQQAILRLASSPPRTPLRRPSHLRTIQIPRRLVISNFAISNLQFPISAIFQPLISNSPQAFPPCILPGLVTLAA